MKERLRDWQGWGSCKKQRRLFRVDKAQPVSNGNGVLFLGTELDNSKKNSYGSYFNQARQACSLSQSQSRLVN